MGQEVKDQDTEQKILEAAKQVFHQKGLSGARMQDIADQAGINKALLHYYFRKKEALFEKVFFEAMAKFARGVMEMMSGEKPLEVKVWAFAENYIDFISKNPSLPIFILNELHQYPDKIQAFVKENFRLKYKVIQHQLEEEHAKGNIRKVAADQFIANLLGLCVFPFIARPMLSTVCEMEEGRFEEMLEERKKMIPEMMMVWLRS